MIIKEQDHHDLFICLIYIVLNIHSTSSRVTWRQVTIGREAVTRSEPTEVIRGKEMTPEQTGARQRQHFQCHFSSQRNDDDGLGDRGRKRKTTVVQMELKG